MSHDMSHEMLQAHEKQDNVHTEPTLNKEYCTPKRAV